MVNEAQASATLAGVPDPAHIQRRPLGSRHDVSDPSTDPALADPLPVTRPRRGWVAGLLTFLTPGLGHLYAGDPRKAAVVFLGMFLLSTALQASLVRIPTTPVALALWLAVAVAFLGAAVISAVRTAHRADKDYRPRRYNRWYAYAGVVVLASIAHEAMTTLVRHGTTAVRLPSSAMEPTLLPGDFLFVDRFRTPAPAIDRGSLLAYTSLTQEGVLVLKRVTGLPGDTLEMRSDTLFLNGRPLAEPYVKHVDPANDPYDPEMDWQQQYLLAEVPRATYRPTRSTWGPLVVPPGHLFVLGDNRHNSYDSRYYGHVPMDHAWGTTRFIYFSYNVASWKLFPFLTDIRWERIGTWPGASGAGATVSAAGPPR